MTGQSVRRGSRGGADDPQDVFEHHVEGVADTVERGEDLVLVLEAQGEDEAQRVQVALTVDADDGAFAPVQVRGRKGDSVVEVEGGGVRAAVLERRGLAVARLGVVEIDGVALAIEVPSPHEVRRRNVSGKGHGILLSTEGTAKRSLLHVFRTLSTRQNPAGRDVRRRRLED